MAFTRFHDDPARIKKTLEESVYSGDYYINAPGPGVYVPMQNDVQLRMQKWGANMYTNTVNLESELLNIDKKLGTHSTDRMDHLKQTVMTGPVAFPVSNPFTEESRATHPAYQYRDLEQSNWSFPQLNPQNLATIEQPFLFDIQTRIVQRDHFSGSVRDLTTAEPVIKTPFEPRNFFPLAAS